MFTDKYIFVVPTNKTSPTAVTIHSPFIGFNVQLQGVNR